MPLKEGMAPDMRTDEKIAWWPAVCVHLATTTSNARGQCGLRRPSEGNAARRWHTPSSFCDLGLDVIFSLIHMGSTVENPCNLSSAKRMPARNISEIVNGISWVTGRSLRESRSHHYEWPGRKLGEIAPISDNNCYAMGRRASANRISLFAKKSKTAQ
jgi:hypothetical protein